MRITQTRCQVSLRVARRSSDGIGQKETDREVMAAAVTIGTTKVNFSVSKI